MAQSQLWFAQATVELRSSDCGVALLRGIATQHVVAHEKLLRASSNLELIRYRVRNGHEYPLPSDEGRSREHTATCLCATDRLVKFDVVVQTEPSGPLREDIDDSV